MQSPTPQIKVSGSTLTITIDLSQRHGSTKSGRALFIASTQGWLDITPTISLSLNCVLSLKRLERREAQVRVADSIRKFAAGDGEEK